MKKQTILAVALSLVLFSCQKEKEQVTMIQKTIKGYLARKLVDRMRE